MNSQITISARFAASLRIAGLVFCALSAAPALAQTEVERGAALVKRHCSDCHAIGAEGASPIAKAPPLRIIARKYRPEDLEEAVAEGIMVGHQGADMPPFTFDPPQIEALTAYLRRLRQSKP